MNVVNPDVPDPRRPDDADAGADRSKRRALSARPATSDDDEAMESDRERMYTPRRALAEGGFSRGRFADYRYDAPSMPPLAAAAEPAPFSWLPFLLHFVARRWPLMATFMALCGGAALLYALSATPQYTASTQLLVDIRRADLLSQQHDIEDSQTLNSELESRVEILRSEGLARRVVTRLHLDQDSGAPVAQPSLAFRLAQRLTRLLHPAGGAAHGPDNALDTATLGLMRMTSVRRIGLTYVIEIGVTSPSAMRSAQLANAIVDTYVSGQLSAQDQVTRQAGQWLQQRLQELRDQAVSAGNAVERYKAAKHIIGTDQGLLNEQQLSALNVQLAAARQRSAAAKAMADGARAELTGNAMAAGQGEDLKNPILNTLRATYLDDQQRAQRWSTEYGARNGQVQKLRDDMAQTELAIRNELQRIAAIHQNDYNVAHADEVTIQAQLDAMVGQTVRTNNDRVELRSLQSSADTYRAVYENFLNRYTQAVQDESFPVSEARVITTAQPPLTKSAPHTKMLVSLGCLLGLAAGFVIAFSQDLLDRRLRTRDQLRAATGLACIGQLPRLRDNLPAPGAPASVSTALVAALPGRPNLRAVLNEPHSEFAQALRALTVRITRDDGFAEPIKLVGFVSARRGDGSSTVAANFAQFLARSGYRTLLVDGDAEDDGLSRAFAPDAAEGLLDAMAEPDRLHGLIRPEVGAGLDFLPLGGKRGHLPLRFTATPSQRLVLTRLLATHDYVVVDLPPLSPAVEAHGFANLLDAFVLVVDWGKMDQEVLVEDMSGALLDRSRFIGAVYNKVDAKEQRRYVVAKT